MTNLVQDEVSPEDILQDTWIPNLRVVASGPIPIGPITALSNHKIRALLESLRTLADVIVLTSSPILFEREYVISDACVLASKVDGVILVIDSRTIKPKEAQKVVELLKGAKATMIGTVLNDVTDY